MFRLLASGFRLLAKTDPDAEGINSGFSVENLCYVFTFAGEFC
jgi:hypothetical protein